MSKRSPFRKNLAIVKFVSSITCYYNPVAEGKKYRIEMDVKNRDNQTLTVISQTTGKIILTSNGEEVKGKFSSEDVLHFQETRKRLMKTSQRTGKAERER